MKTGNSDAFFREKYLTKNSIIAKINNRTKIRTLYLRVIVDGVYPQIQYDVHFRAFSHANQFMDCGYWEKEKANILLAGVIVLQ